MKLGYLIKTNSLILNPIRFNNSEKYCGIQIEAGDLNSQDFETCKNQNGKSSL
jgi:hypothetical protein